MPRNVRGSRASGKVSSISPRHNRVSKRVDPRVGAGRALRKLFSNGSRGPGADADVIVLFALRKVADGYELESTTFGFDDFEPRIDDKARDMIVAFLANDRGSSLSDIIDVGNRAMPLARDVIQLFKGGK